MKKITIYIAGPLFAEYEQKQRLYEGKKIRESLNKLGIDFKIGNPIEFDVNPTGDNPTQPSQDVIYEADASFIDSTNVFFFDLCNEDSGTMVELGMAFEKLRQGKDIKIYPVHSDFRVMSNTEKGFGSTIGFNSFVIGGILKHGFKMFTSFDESLEAFLKDLKND